MHHLTEMINRVKVLNLSTATQMARDDVGGMYGILLPGQQPRIVRRVFSGAERMGQVMCGQHTLNRSQAGRRFDTQSLQVALDSALANETILRFGRATGFTCA